MSAHYKIAYELYPYRKVAEQDASSPKRHPVVIVGGGPVGMSLALDLGRKGTPVLLLDEHVGVGDGSRAICFARRTLEISDRLNCAQPMLEFHHEDEVFNFNLTEEQGLKNPAFINLPQPDFEKFIVEQIREEQQQGKPIEIRGRNCVTGLTAQQDCVVLRVDTPDGTYQLEAQWLIACDGARSPLRNMMGLGFEGRVFEDNFLIADVKMSAGFPAERWFWFEPPFKNAGQSALLHKQPDDIWRIDFQLGWDIDRDYELDPSRIRARVDAMLGNNTEAQDEEKQAVKVEYELEWTSIYTFQCRRMQRFRHQRVLFAGDSAHQVSPFGARGANSGVQDADNLGWKLDLVCKGLASDTLLDSYSEERVHGANENILNSTRSTDFLTPKSAISKTFRNAVLGLARQYSFAQPLVNSGRLSVPCVYDGLSLNGPDNLPGPQRTRVGAACVDVALSKNHLPSYLLGHLGDDFILLCINTQAPDPISESGITLGVLSLADKDDPTGALQERYLGKAPTAVYLIRPDQHVCARWPTYNEPQVRQCIRTIINAPMLDTCAQTT